MLLDFKIRDNWQVAIEGFDQVGLSIRESARRYVTQFLLLKDACPAT